MKKENNNPIMQLPFAGFYCTWHDESIDNEIACLLSDDSGEPYADLIEQAYDAIDYRAVYEAYASSYVDALLSAIGGDAMDSIEFESLHSPKAYNFATDRIFVRVQPEFIRTMVRETHTDILKRMVREQYTSCDGFISHYSNNLKDWPSNVMQWDHNQLRTLFEAWLESQGHEIDECDLLLDEIASKALDEAGDKAIALFDDAHARRTRCAA